MSKQRNRQMKGRNGRKEGREERLKE